MAKKRQIDVASENIICFGLLAANEDTCAEDLRSEVTRKSFAAVPKQYTSSTRQTPKLCKDHAAARLILGQASHKGVIKSWEQSKLNRRL